METFFAVLYVVVLIGVVLLLMMMRERKVTRNLTSLAARTGLRFRPSKENETGVGSSVEGEFQGRPARFWTYATGAGKSRTEWVAVSVRLAVGSRLTMQLKPQGFGTKVADFSARRRSRWVIRGSTANGSSGPMRRPPAAPRCSPRSESV